MKVSDIDLLTVGFNPDQSALFLYGAHEKGGTWSSVARSFNLN